MSRTPWTIDDGKQLREARKTLGISQAQLGVAVGVTSSRICEVERVNFPGGRHCSPGKELGAKIASHLGKLAGQAKKRAEKDAAKAKLSTEKGTTKAETKKGKIGAAEVEVEVEATA